MRLIVGLGNPGKQYEQTRHNIGFILTSQLAQRQQCGDFSLEKKFQAVVSKGMWNKESVIYMKPMTYMNISGKSVLAACQFYKIPHEKVIVIHDEIDFANGVIKKKIGGSHAGHNGIRDIIARLGSREFHRIRIGVGRPSHPEYSISDYVLGSFSVGELNAINDRIDYIETLINQIIQQEA